jgi:hypothetical protein
LTWRICNASWRSTLSSDTCRLGRRALIFGRPFRSLLSLATLVSWNLSRPSSLYFGRLSSIDEVILFSDFTFWRDVVALEDVTHCLALAPATTVRGPAGPPAFEPHPLSRFASFDFEPVLPRPRRARHMSGSSFKPVFQRQFSFLHLPLLRLLL